MKARKNVSANLYWLVTERGILSDVVKHISYVAGIKVETENEAFMTKVLKCYCIIC